MPLEPGDKIWIAEAPPGIPSPGPAVVFDLTKYGVSPQDILNRYKLMGWTITLATVVEAEEE